ncbi:MAG: hypothetical protein QM756_36700 [Polyangiaceae bacterium]
MKPAPTKGFSVVGPSSRTMLYAAPHPPSKPSNPQPAADKPRFTDGGTQVLARADAQPPTVAVAATQRFGVDELLARRAQQQPPSELDAAEDLEPLKIPKHPLGRYALRGLMLCLVGASAWMFSLPPEASTPELPTASSAPAPHVEAAKPAPTLAPAALELPQLDARLTLQRAAADTLAEGRYADALLLYRKLAESEPENRAYAQVIKTLEQRAAKPSQR